MQNIEACFFYICREIPPGNQLKATSNTTTTLPTTSTTTRTTIAIAIAITNDNNIYNKCTTNLFTFL